MKLTLDSAVRGIDSRVATRRVGAKEKGPPAHVVLADSLGTSSVRQLLHHYPRTHIDRSRVAPVRDLRIGHPATVVARVKKVDRRVTYRNKKTLVTLVLTDGTGTLDLPFFNQPWKARQFAVGEEVSAWGIVDLRGGRRQMKSGEVESLKDDDRPIHTRRIIPIHRAAEGIYARTIRELVFLALERLPKIPDPLPPEIVGAERLSSFDQAIRKI